MLKNIAVFIMIIIFPFFSSMVTSQNKYHFIIINNTPLDIHCNLQAPTEKIDRIITIKANQTSQRRLLDFSPKLFLLKSTKNETQLAFSLICIPDVNPEKNSIWPCKINIKKMTPFDENNHSNCGFASFGANTPSKKYNLSLIQDRHQNKLIATFTERDLKFLIVPATQSPADAIDTERVLYEIIPNHLGNE